MPEDQEDFGLIMPFVVCKSQGGPYDDQCFVAGYELGFIDALLTSKISLLERYLRTDSLPLVDLLAMRHGYSIASKPWDEHPDEWSLVRLTRQGAGI